MDASHYDRVRHAEVIAMARAIVIENVGRNEHTGATPEALIQAAFTVAELFFQHVDQRR